MSIDERKRPRATGVTGAYTFFAALYFVQSIGDPTSGLIAQPVRSLLRSWGESPATLGALMALLALPWTIKPLFGLLSDFVPLFGSRRRNYLLLANGLAAFSLLVLASIPLSPRASWLLFALLLPTTVGIALGDVIVDALMVEKGQPLGLTGRFQSIQWTAANMALLLTGGLGGYIAEQRLQSFAFALCSGLWMVALAITWRYAGDDRAEHLDTASLRDTAAALIETFREPLFLTVCALLTLWSFNPVWGSVLYLHMTEGLGFSEQAYGNVTSAFFAGRCSAASVMASTVDRCDFQCCCTFPSWPRHCLQRRLLASEQLGLRLRHLRVRRSRLHDRHAHSIGSDRAHHTGAGCGDDFRYRHGTHQFCRHRIGSLWELAVRDHSGFLWTRDGLQPGCRGECRRSRELLGIDPRAAPSQPAMVGTSLLTQQRTSVRRGNDEAAKEKIG